jgi:ketosteroid isomerase-like protein
MSSSCKRLEAFLEGNQETTAQLVDPELEFHGTVGGLQEGQIAPRPVPDRRDVRGGRSGGVGRAPAGTEKFIDAGDNVVVLLHEYRRGRGSGMELEAKTAVVVAVRGGRVVRIQGYLDRDAALEAVGLSE